MADDQRGGRIASPLRRVPPDLTAVVVLVAVSDAFILVPVLSETPIRAFLAFPLLLFLPGYALLAALYPERSGKPTFEGGFVFPYEGSDRGVGGPLRDGRLGGLERFVLSFGLSVAIVALTGLSLNFTSWGIRLVPVVASVSGFTVAASVVAAFRRLALPADERFSVPYRRYLAAARDSAFAPASRTDAALNVLLAVAVLVAATSVAFAVWNPDRGEDYSELYLLTRGDDGTLLADDFPTEFQTGQPTEIVVGVGNHEHEPVEYTVVGELQRVRTAGNESTVVATEEVARFGVDLAHNESALRDVSVDPPLTGDRLRLVFLLYRGDPPPDPSMASAYRSTYLWVDVLEG